MQKEYDIMVVGPISLDHNIDYLGNERRDRYDRLRLRTADLQ